jgi:hypothetical protein
MLRIPLEPVHDQPHGNPDQEHKPYLFEADGPRTAAIQVANPEHSKGHVPPDGEVEACQFHAAGIDTTAGVAEPRRRSSTPGSGKLGNDLALAHRILGHAQLLVAAEGAAGRKRRSAARVEEERSPMSKLKWTRPSPALIVSVIALIVALAGTAYAAGKINGGSIVKQSIGGGKLKKNTLTGFQINTSKIGTVPSAKRATNVFWVVQQPGRPTTSPWRGPTPPASPCRRAAEPDGEFSVRCLRLRQRRGPQQCGNRHTGGCTLNQRRFRFTGVKGPDA